MILGFVSPLSEIFAMTHNCVRVLANVHWLDAVQEVEYRDRATRNLDTP